MRIVTLPGIGGSDEQHWQTLWEQASPEMRRIAPASWDEPDFDNWCDALDAAVGDERALLVAHSLSCLLAVRWAAANPDRVLGLFLVAAPDPAGPKFPRQAPSFGLGLDVQPPVPALLITSDNDPYCLPEQSKVFAEMWQIPAISVGQLGHLNSASGLGFWNQGRNLLTAFLSAFDVPSSSWPDEL